MTAKDKAYIGAKAVFDVPHKPDYPVERIRGITTEVARILNSCTDDEFATVLIACMMILGERIAEKRESKNDK